MRRGCQFALPPAITPVTPSIPKVDILFVLDVTGSMNEEINGVKEGIQQFSQELSSQKLDAKIGLIAFGDRLYGEESQILSFPDGVFTADPTLFRQKVAEIQQVNGGDAPESSLDALNLAANQPFRSDSTKVILLITDAPPRVPDLTMKSLDEVNQSLKTHNINQLHLVIQPSDQAIYRQLQANDYFINLIWYHGGKIESLSSSDSNKQLLKNLAKVFEAMIKYKKDHEIKTDPNNDYTTLAVITQILKHDVPTDLWKKCHLTVNLGKEDKIALTPEGDKDVTIISLKRKPLWFEPFIPYIIPLLITLLLQGASLVFIFALKQQIESVNQELQLMTELTLPDGLDKIVNDLAQYQKIDKTKSKKAIIKIFKLQKSLSEQKEINWKQLIENYQTGKKIKPTGIVGVKSDSQTREAIIKDIKVSLGLSTPSPTVDTNWQTNVKSLNAIVEDNAHDDSEKGKRKGLIVKILDFPKDTPYEDIIKQENSQQLKEKIKAFQKQQFHKWNTYDGLMSEGGDTYKKLNSLVSLRLSNPPSSQPEIDSPGP